MNHDSALLALIVDDERALKVLAAWLAYPAARLIDLDNPELAIRLADLSGVYIALVKQILPRLAAAHVIVDGGITELADKLLQTYVQTKLGGKTKRK